MPEILPLKDITAAGWQSVSESLSHGGLVCLPSDTVYGLACRPQSAAAVKRVYEVKGREFDKPLALAFRDTDEIFSLIPGLPAQVKAAAGRLMPGPVTVIVPVPSGELAGLEIIGSGSAGVRVVPPPEGELHRRLPSPLALTSANLSAEPDPASVEEIPEAIKEACDFIIDGGPTRHRRPSTIVDLRPLGENGAP
ncbi:MAG: L-threonylcarbamoyladenylate synthase, partial [Actinomycetota bacterium]